MEPTLAAATLAYTDALARKAEPGAAAGAAAADQAGGPSFGELLHGLMDQSIAAGEAGEAATMKAAAHQAELVDVITAVTNAEVTLQTVVAVRDQVVEAYQRIMRMPI